ncbi:MAG: DnaA/Hda family protein [Pirellulaceae bacterium]
MLRSTLIKRIGQDRFDLWFGDRVRMDMKDGALVVAAGESFTLERLRTSFRRDLAESAAQVLGGQVAVEFELDTMLIEPAGSTCSLVDVKVDAMADSTQAVGAASSSTPAPHFPLTSTTPFAPASPTSSTRRFASLASYVVGDGNRLAYTVAESTVRRLGEVSPVFFCGPTGCGKTHLLEGVWSLARRKSPKQRVVMLSAEQFTTYFIEALRGSGLPNFRRKYRDADLLLIDDVQFFVGKKATVVELIHTIDTFIRHGRQLVLAADRPPTELSALGPEIAARLTGGLVCNIEPLDGETRLGVLRKIAARCGAAIDEETFALLADRLNGDARVLAGAVHRLQASSEALRQPISVHLAEKALTDIFQSTQKVVRLADVERAVCDVFGVEPETLQSAGKSRGASQPRMLAMWLARKYTRAAFSEIGRHFGRRSHSTVISAEKKVNAWRAEGAELQLAHGVCRADDAIRRIETRLRCG